MAFDNWTDLSDKDSLPWTALAIHVHELHPMAPLSFAVAVGCWIPEGCTACGTTAWTALFAFLPVVVVQCACSRMSFRQWRAALMEVKCRESGYFTCSYMCCFRFLFFIFLFSSFFFRFLFSFFCFHFPSSSCITQMRQIPR